MEVDIPAADLNGPEIPLVAAEPPHAERRIVPAPHAEGAVQQPIAPPPKRQRIPLGLTAKTPGASSSGAPPLLELAAAYPLRTIQCRTPNTFVPDAQMLFHVLGLCDQKMNTTDRFLKSATNWIPIVSQLYVSVLWNYMILNINVKSGYGKQHSTSLTILDTYLNPQECMIPGPLVPYFQSLAASSGPFDWMGDILPTLPGFGQLWDREAFRPRSQYARAVPIPALLLDQLIHFSTYQPPAGVDLYNHFEWYRNIFSQGATHHSAFNRIGPQLCGSLYTTKAQFDLARSFWNPVLRNSINRIQVGNDNPALFVLAQLLGITSQTGGLQISWFQHVSAIMQTYCHYFNASVPLRSIHLTGTGAVSLYGDPIPGAALRNWLYPHVAHIEPFTSLRFAPRREIPSSLGVAYHHADHDLEAMSEQYGLLAHTHIRWENRIAPQNGWAAIAAASQRTGEYWNLQPHRHSRPIFITNQIAAVVSSRYHQPNAKRVT